MTERTNGWGSRPGRGEERRGGAGGGRILVEMAAGVEPMEIRGGSWPMEGLR